MAAGDSGKRLRETKESDRRAALLKLTEQVKFSGGCPLQLVLSSHASNFQLTAPIDTLCIYLLNITYLAHETSTCLYFVIMRVLNF